MTQRGFEQAMPTSPFSEETPMDDILSSIRSMVVEEEMALDHLKKLSQQVNDMVEALPPERGILEGREVVFSENEGDKARPVSSSTVPEPFLSGFQGESSVALGSEDSYNPSSDHEHHDRMPLPGLDDLADIAEDFLTEEGHESPAHSQKYAKGLSDDEERFGGGEIIPIPLAFVQEFEALNAQQEHKRSAVGSAFGKKETAQPEDFYSSSHEDVVHLTAVVNADGSLTSRFDAQGVGQNLAHGLAAQITSVRAEDNTVLAQAFELVVARLAEPMIAKWLEEHGAAIVAQIMNNRGNKGGF